jgi:PGF-CTERM protein
LSHSNNTHNLITGNTANSNKDYGISLRSSGNNNITGNTVSGNDCGIDLSSSRSNTVTDNTANLNNDGILLHSSSNNTLRGNNASKNNQGIHLYFSNNNTLSNNTADSNKDDGIRLERLSNNNTLTNNTASGNTNDFYSKENAHDNNIEYFTISSTTISFIYEHGIKIKSVTTPEPDPAGKVNIGKYVNVTNETEDSWILLNISYSDADVTIVEEASLRMYRWTGTDWAEIAGSGVNTVENYVYANVTTFSQIAAFGDPTPTPTPTPTPAPRRGGGGGGSSGPCDTDGDGYGDIDEIINGTDPYDPCDPDPTCIACLASRGGRVLPKPAVKPQATQKLVPTPEPAPTSKPAPVPTPVPEPEKPGIPGFEAVFAVAGLLAVAYLMRRKKK